LPLSQQAVQSVHSATEYVLRTKDIKWDNGTVVLLGVENEDELKRWMAKLDWKGIEYSYFVEPDIGDQITSLAAVTENEKVFSKLRLLNFMP
jgi:hypothetical protein